MKSIITKHNKKLLSQPTATDDARKCNCPREVTCPLNGNCLAKAIVYRGEVVSETETKEYTGLTEPKWKSRFANHLSSFRNAEKKNSTSLAKYIWDLKDKNIPYEIKWTLHKQAFPYKCGTRKCDLCLSEKLEILKGDPRTMLNKKSEIMNKCLHRAKHKLRAVKWTLDPPCISFLYKICLGTLCIYCDI